MQMDEVPAWLAGARLAPSAHNTQPWRFSPLPDGSIRVGWDESRALPHSDPTSRDLYLGLGAAVEAACLRSTAVGRPLRFIPDATDEPHSTGCFVPVDTQPESSELALAGSLETRHTARTPHLARAVPPELLDGLSTEAERAGGRLRVVTGRDGIRRLAVLARRATAALYADPAVHAELWHWLRLDPTDPAYRRDGLTADCLELRGAALAAARLLLPPERMRLLVRLGVHHLLAYDAQRTLLRCASVCLLTAPASDRDTLLRAGQGLLRLWLMADAAGLSTHPMSALLDCAETVDPTLAVFGATGELPAAVFRLGYCPPVARAPRLPAGELVEAGR
jgi:nitroreductase